MKNAFQASHAQDTQQSLTDKFLANQLTAHEWLTDIDIRKLLQTCGLDNTYIGSLDANAIGYALHCIRVQHQHDAPLRVYQLPMMINCGPTGSMLDQGSHWVSAIATIDPTQKPGSITFDYQDSSNLTPENKTKILHTLQEAARYPNNLNAQPEDKQFRAFANYHTQCHFNDRDTQTETWLCGYQAVKDLIERCHSSHDLSHNPWAEQFHRIANDASQLRNLVYKALLSGLTIDPTTYHQSDVDESAFIHNSKTGLYQLSVTYYQHYLSLIDSSPSHQVVSAKLSLDALIDQQNLNSLKLAHLATLKDRLSPLITLHEAYRQLSLDSLTIALPNLSNEDFSITDKAHLQAFSQFLTQYNINTLELEDLEQLTLTLQHQFAQALYPNTSLTTIKPTNADKQLSLDESLSQLLLRNQLFQHVHLNCPNDSDPWQHFWLNRFSDSTFFQDHAMTKSSLAILPLGSLNSLNNTVEFASLLSQGIKQVYAIYCRSLLENLQSWHAHNDSFPFHTLEMNLGQEPDETLLKQTLSLFNEHLEAHTISKLPLNNIIISLHSMSADSFNEFKHFIDLSQKTNLKSLEVIFAPYQGQLRILSKDQLNELKQLYETHQYPLIIDLQLPSETLKSLAETDSEHYNAYIELMNTITQTRRIHQSNPISSRSVVNKTTVQNNTFEPALQASTSESPLLRPCKLSNTLSWNLEITQEQTTNIEQELEQSIAYDQAHDQQQQIDTAINVQQQADIDLFVPESDADQLPEDFTQNDNLALLCFNRIILSSRNADELSHHTLFTDSSDPQLAIEILGDHLLGSKALPKSVRYVSQQAISKILMHIPDFISGLHIDNLPPGFMVCSTSSSHELVLDYHLGHQDAHQPNPLTPKLEGDPSFKKWLGDLRQFIPDAKSESYNLATFAGIIPQRYGNPKPEAATWAIFESSLAGVSSEADKDQLLTEHSWCLSASASEKAFFKPGQDLLILMDIIYREGFDGLKIWLEALKNLYNHNAPLYQFIKDSIITRHYNTASQQGTPTQIEAITTLIDLQLTHAQTIWFKDLVHNEVEQLGYVDLPTVTQAFSYFLEQLPPHITLPLPCPLIDPNLPNMQVVLDRFLATLSQVPGRHLQDQLNHLEELDYSAEGVWYASRWEGFHFFHKAMGLTPDALTDPSYQQVEQDLLNRSNPSYRVDLNHLKTLAQTAVSLNDSQFYYAHILWHRYLGRCERLHTDYNYYIALSDAVYDLKQLDNNLKMQALSLLAIASTGLRGANGQDYQPFLNWLNHQAQSNMETLRQALTQLVTVADQLHPHFNVVELTALSQYLMGLTNEEQTSLLSELQQYDCINYYQALSQWGQNPKHISAQKLQHYRQSITDDWPAIWQMLSCCHNANIQDSLFQELTTQLTKLQQHTPSNYLAILSLLGSIDCQRAPSDHLLTLTQINQLIASILSKQLTTVNQVYALLHQQYPNIHIHTTLGTETTIIDFDANLAEEIDQLNQSLQAFGIEPWDKNKLTGSAYEVSQYINQRYEQLYQLLINSAPGGAITVSLVWPKIKQNIKDLLSKIFLARVDKAIHQIPQLRAIVQYVYTPPELVMHNPDKTLSQQEVSLGGSAVGLQHYGQQAGELLEQLVSCRQNWGPAFSIESLLSSPRVNSQQFTLTQLNTIVSALRELKLKHLPQTLLDTIFASTRLPEAIKPQAYTRVVIDLLNTDNLPLKAMTRLLSVFHKPKQFDYASGIANKLDTPEGLAIIQLCLEKITDNTVDLAIISTIHDDVLRCFRKDQESIKQLFRYTNYNIYQLKDIIGMIHELTEADRNTQIGLINILTYCQSSEPIDTLELLIQWVNQRKQDLQAIIELYQGIPPYPSVNQLHTWLNLNATQNLQNALRQHELDPCGLRQKEGVIDEQFDNSLVCSRLNEWRDLTRGLDQANHFGVRGRPLFYTHRAQLAEQMTYINEVGHRQNLLLPGMFEDIRSQLGFTEGTPPVTQLTRWQIKTLIKQYRNILSHPEKFALSTIAICQCEFAALAREAMYRSHAKGAFPYSTQMLALLNMMRNNSSSISEIRTGEGKGIITALYAAAQWMTGSAVDVCSANLELAQRDLAEFKNFFAYLDIPTTLIEANSPISDYLPNGINYSTVAQKALFDEKCLTEGEDLPDQVSLVLDEADRILDDTTQYRFATSLDPQFNPWINPYEWAYPVLLDFVTPLDQFKNNGRTKSQDIQDLKDFVQNEHNTPQLTPQQRSSFLEIPDQQLDMWLDSSVVALSLEEDEDFVIRTKADPRSPDDSEQLIAMAVLRDREQHRLMPDSRLSNGAQQLLHTRLNRQRDPDQPAFWIEPEKTYLASRSGKNFIDSYQRQGRGKIAGLTGTCGKAELNTLYDYGFSCYQIPPHRPLNRIDQPVLLAKAYRKQSARKQQLDYIVEDARLAHQKGQSVLIFGQGITDSQAIYQHLQNHFADSALQLYNGEQNIPEAQVVAQAGQTGMITVSTPMLGRGTDIKPQSQNGLHVISTSIAGEREYCQHVGRSGRNGAHGSSRLILQTDDLAPYCQRHNLPLPTEPQQIEPVIQDIRLELATNKADSLAESQAVADLKDQFFQQFCQLARSIKKQIEQLGIDTNYDYRETLHNLQKNLNLTWNAFLVQFDESWDKQIATMRNSHHQIDLQTAITQQKQLAQQQWLTTFNSLIGQAQQTAQLLQPNEPHQLNLPEEPDDVKAQLASLAPPYEAAHGIDIDTRPLDENITNPTAVYYQIKQLLRQGEITDDIKQQALKTELDAISHKLNLSIDSSPIVQIDRILQLLLNQRAQAHLSNSPKPSQRPIYQHLMHIIAQWGQTDSQQLVRQRHNEHLSYINKHFFFRDHPHYTSYMQQMLADITYYSRLGSFGDQGFDFSNAVPQTQPSTKTTSIRSAQKNPHRIIFKQKASKTVKSTVEQTTEPQPITIEQFKSWFNQELTSYSKSGWPGPNKQRRQQIKLIREALDQQYNNEADYIQNLVWTFNQTHEAIMADDLRHDRHVKNSWWPFARFRNSRTGGRLQNLLNTMQGQISLYAAEKQYTFNFNQQMNHIKTSLETLLDRAQLSNLTNKKLESLLEPLSREHLATWQQHQLLELVAKELDNWHHEYKSKIDRKKSSSAEEDAFDRTLQNVQQQVSSLDATFKMTGSNQTTTNLETMQQDLSTAFNNVLHHDTIKKSGLSLAEFRDKIQTDPSTLVEQHDLLASLLHETQRLFLLHHPEAQEFELSPITYEPGQSEINIKAHFITPFTDQQGEPQNSYQCFNLTVELPTSNTGNYIEVSQPDIQIDPNPTLKAVVKDFKNMPYSSTKALTTLACQLPTKPQSSAAADFTYPFFKPKDPTTTTPTDGGFKP